ANSPANISPVGPPPAITTPWLVTTNLRSAPRRSRQGHHIARTPRSPALRTPAPACRVPAAAWRGPPRVRRARATHPPTTRLASRDSSFRRFPPRPTIPRHGQGLATSPVCHTLRMERSRSLRFPWPSAVDGQPAGEAAPRTAVRRPRRISYAPHAVIT